MDSSITYWRDQVGLLLKSGAAIIILFSGWALEHHKDFDLTSADADLYLAAIGLLSMSLIYAIFLSMSVWMIYRHRIGASLEPTLLPQRAAILIAGGLSMGVLLIAVAMSVR